MTAKGTVANAFEALRKRVRTQVIFNKMMFETRQQVSLQQDEYDRIMGRESRPHDDLAARHDNPNCGTLGPTNACPNCAVTHSSFETCIKNAVLGSAVLGLPRSHWQTLININKQEYILGGQILDLLDTLPNSVIEAWDTSPILNKIEYGLSPSIINESRTMGSLERFRQRMNPDTMRLFDQMCQLLDSSPDITFSIGLRSGTPVVSFGNISQTA